MRYVIVVLIVCGLMSACGVRGPLTYPKHNESAEAK